MNTLLLYMVKAAFYLAAFYIVYFLFLSKDTFYKRNRCFILTALALAFLLPLVTIYTEKPVNLPLFGRTLSEVLVTGSSAGIARKHLAIDVPGLISVIYLAGLLLFAVKLMFDLGELAMLIFSTRKKGTNIIRFTGLNTAGFSALGYIFINDRLAPSDSNEIIRHEQNHLDYYHFFDIVILEIVKVLQWFNPFVHMFNRSLREVHEYQADEWCLSMGITVTNYQNLLMNQVFRSKEFSITNSFSNPTLIKKRMIMMTKKRSGTLANLKLLMVLPVIAIVLIAFSSCGGKTKPAVSTNTEIAPPPPPPPPPPPVPVDSTKQKVMLGDEMKPGTPPPPPPPQGPIVQNGDTAWYAVDKQPVFAGGEAALYKFIGDSTRYPAEAKEKNIQGRVIVRFVVTVKGEVKSASVVRSVNPALDAEALRVINLLPNFVRPGYQHGVAVPVWYMVPINFSLK